jgi:hypothetical protein
MESHANLTSAEPAPGWNQGEKSIATKRVCASAIVLLTWFALILRLYLTATASLAPGVSRAQLIANYFSFFTILTNLLVAAGLSLSLVAPHSRWGEMFSRQVAVSGTAIYIAIVGVTYSFLLRDLWNPQGAEKVADVLLHDFVPLLFVAYWLVFVPKGSLRWKDALYWLPYPLIYFAYSLIRGAITGWYPYPFIDVNSLGYARVLTNAAMLVCGFLAVALLTVTGDRWIGKKYGAKLAVPNLNNLY